MVVMLNRPALQRQEFQRRFHRLRSLQRVGRRELLRRVRARRARRSDHCTRRRISSPTKIAGRGAKTSARFSSSRVYADGLTPWNVLHIVCKPNGGVWVERKLDQRTNLKEWDVVEGAGVRYATTTPQGGKWNGELAIPWKLIGDEARGLPSLLRFNFIQHRTEHRRKRQLVRPGRFRP